jgi:hypothetical protein
LTSTGTEVKVSCGWGMGFQAFLNCCPPSPPGFEWIFGIVY